MEGQKNWKGLEKMGKIEKTVAERETAEEHEESKGGCGLNLQPADANMEVCFAVIHTDMKVIGLDMKSELSNFWDQLKDDMKEDLISKLKSNRS